MANGRLNFSCFIFFGTSLWCDKVCDLLPSDGYLQRLRLEEQDCAGTAGAPCLRPLNFFKKHYRKKKKKKKSNKVLIILYWYILYILYIGTYYMWYILCTTFSIKNHIWVSFLNIAIYLFIYFVRVLLHPSRHFLVHSMTHRPFSISSHSFMITYVT